MELKNTLQWHQTAIPNPTKDNQRVMLGVHFEEIAEMLDSISLEHHPELLIMAKQAMTVLANSLKTDNNHVITINDRVEFLDSLCDQAVTGTGCAHMFQMDIIGGLNEVNRSNFSKFEDGKPVFNEHGKIKKGKYYVKPNLSEFV